MLRIFIIWSIYFSNKFKAYLRRLMVVEYEWRIDNSVCETENRCVSRRTSVLNKKVLLDYNDLFFGLSFVSGIKYIKAENKYITYK